MTDKKCKPTKKKCKISSQDIKNRGQSQVIKLQKNVRFPRKLSSIVLSYRKLLNQVKRGRERPKKTLKEAIRKDINYLN